MAIVVHMRGGTLRITRRALISCIVIGALLPGANSILFFAERNVPTGLASLIIASVPLWVAVLRLTQEHLPWQGGGGGGGGLPGGARAARPPRGGGGGGGGLLVLFSGVWVRPA